jgi:hypothetical protein
MAKPEGASASEKVWLAESAKTVATSFQVNQGLLRKKRGERTYAEFAQKIGLPPHRWIVLSSPSRASPSADSQRSCGA